MSLLIGKERFSGVFSPEIEKYEVGDLVEIKYNKVGFLNKIDIIRLIAKSSKESGLFARIANLIFMLGIFIFALLRQSLFIMGLRWNLILLGLLLH